MRNHQPAMKIHLGFGAVQKIFDTFRAPPLTLCTPDATETGLRLWDVLSYAKSFTSGKFLQLGRGPLSPARLVTA